MTSNRCHTCRIIKYPTHYVTSTARTRKPGKCRHANTPTKSTSLVGVHCVVALLENEGASVHTCFSILFVCTFLWPPVLIPTSDMSHLMRKDTLEDLFSLLLSLSSNFLIEFPLSHTQHTNRLQLLCNEPNSHETANISTNLAMRHHHILEGSLNRAV